MDLPLVATVIQNLSLLLITIAYYFEAHPLSHQYFYPRASEQGNVIRSVRIYIYIYMCVCVCVSKKIVIERTRDLIYLKFVATDFFPKIISSSAGENSGDLT